MAFEHGRRRVHALEEARLDIGIGPADEHEGEQVEPERLGRHMGMETGDDALRGEAPDAVVGG